MNTDVDRNAKSNTKIFVPFSEELLAAAGTPLGELVPYQLEYRCVRLLDGTFDFSPDLNSEADGQLTLQMDLPMVHAA